MRVTNSTNNILASVIGQIFALAITFINRTVFIRALDIELLGVQGLFSNILSILSLAEMGFAIAITYSLYKPLAENDEKIINGLLNFFRVIYLRIGIFSLITGLLLIPFLKYIIKGEASIPNIQLYFVIFLLNNVVFYLFSYKRFLLLADQKNYIVVSTHYFYFFLSNVLQIVTLLIFQNFIIYLCINVASKLAENISISTHVDKKYPYITDLKKYAIDKETRSSLYKNVYALSYHKIGSILINGSDSIFISSFIGLNVLGIYSNYLLITQAVNLFLGQVFGNLTASIGNLLAQNRLEHSKSLFSSIFLANFWIYGFASVAFYILSKDFMRAWLGQDYVLSERAVLLISVSFLLNGSRKTSLIFKDAMGLFWYDRYKPLAEVIVKISCALLLLPGLQLEGIFWASIISVISTCLWIEPYIVFKYGFGGGVNKFAKDYVTYLFVTILAFLSISFISNTLVLPPIQNLLIKALLCLVIYNLLMFIFVYQRKEFTDLVSLLRSALLSIKKLIPFSHLSSG